MRILSVLFLAANLSVSCASDGKKAEGIRPGESGGGSGPGEQALTGDERQITVDASSKDPDAWTYFDFVSGATSPDREGLSGGWNLAFHRFLIKSNSGINFTGPTTSQSGSSSHGAWVVAVSQEQSFESVVQAPESGFTYDGAAGEHSGDAPDLAFLQKGGWYAYDTNVHKVLPLKKTWVVRVPPSRYFKLEFTGYYSTAGTPGHVSFRWAGIKGPEKISITGLNGEE